MRRPFLLFLACLSAASVAAAQKPADPVAQAVAAGDLFESHKKYDVALDAYRKADSLSHHSSASVYMKMAGAERKLGDFPSALNDAKKAGKIAGDDHAVAVQADLFQAALLSQMAGKPNDKKLKEAEDALRQAVALDGQQTMAHFDLGVVLIRQERDADGIAELKTYVSMPGADPKLVAEANRIIANPIRGREPFAPDFSFVTMDNQTVSNGSLRGKVVLLDFWGSWCPPCRESVPVMRNIERKYADKPFQLVGISSDDDADVWRTFVAAQHMDWAEYLDSTDRVQQAFQIESFPTYVVVDRDGVIRFRQSGFGDTSAEEIEDAINSALKRRSDPAVAAAAASSVAETPAPAPAPAASPAAASGAASAAAPPDAAAEIAGQTPLEAVEAGTVAAGVYKNAELNMSYEFPRGWMPAQPGVLHGVNVRGQAVAEANALQQRPGFDTRHLIVPKVVFYASRRGDGDGQKLSLPCLRIQARPAQLGATSPEAFHRLTQSMATAMNMKIIAEPTQFKVKDHDFLRADFERSSPVHAFEAFIQTVAGDYSLTIEIFATSPDELQKAAESLQSMEISDEDQ